MDKPATRGDSVNLQASLKNDIEIMKNNQKRLENLMVRLLEGYFPPEHFYHLLCCRCAGRELDRALAHER